MSGGGGSTSTTTQQLSPEQQKILGLVSPVFASYFPADAQGHGTGQTTAQTYPGQTLAGQTPLEGLGQQMTLGALPGVQGNINSSQQGANFLASGDVLDIMKNPGLQGAIDAGIRPLTENFGQTILPQIRDEATMAGGYGGNRQGIAEGLASQAYLHQIGDTASNIINPAYQSGLDAMTKGLAVSPLIEQSALLPGQAASGVGAQQRAFEQASIDDMVKRFYSEQFLPLMIAQQVAGTALGFPGGTTISSQSGGETSPLQMGMGGASFLAALAPLMFMSDEGMKEDINPLDHHDVVEALDTLPLATWKYKGDETTHMGPMAQDFAEAFGVGDGKTIHLADVAGVLLSVGKQMIEEVRGNPQ